jgi:hypothetical protein
MSSDTQKFLLQQNIGEVARNGAATMLALIGKSLPASIVSINGSIATVKLEVLSDFNLPTLQMPIAGSLYMREPLQQGDMGFVISCDTEIAAMCGLGEGVADLSQPGNLSAKIFLPLGNANWKPVDANMLVLTGLSDVMIRDNSHQVQLEDLNTMLSSLSSLITTLNSYFGTIGPLLTTPQAFATINPITNAVKPRV